MPSCVRSRMHVTSVSAQRKRTCEGTRVHEGNKRAGECAREWPIRNAHPKAWSGLVSGRVLDT